MSSKKTVIKNTSIDEFNAMRKSTVTKGDVVQISSEIPKSKWAPKSYEFKLPSLNTSVPEDLAPGGIILVRKIVAKEESTLTKDIKNILMNFIDDSESNNNKYKGETLNKFKITYKMLDALDAALNGCIVSEGVSIYQLSSIDKLALFTFLFSITYGESSFSIECDKCKTENKFIKDIWGSSKINFVDEEYPKKIIIESYDKPYDAYFKFVPGEIRASDENDDLYIIKKCLSHIDGVHEEDYEEFINYLSTDDTKKINNFIKNESKKYGIDLSFKFKCSKCKKENNSNYPIEDIIFSFLQNSIPSLDDVK